MGSLCQNSSPSDENALLQSKPHRSARVVKLAATAITVGSAAYNRGECGECYDLYCKVALMLLGVRGNSASPAPVDLLSHSHKYLLYEAIGRAEAQQSDSRKAWTLRLALDELIRAHTSHLPRSPFALKPTALTSINKRACLYGCAQDTDVPSPDEIIRPDFSLLPDDTLTIIFDGLNGRELAQATLVCTVWANRAIAVAEKRMRSWRKLPIGHCVIPSWTHSVAAHEYLISRVGPRPTRAWWREWTVMRVREMQLSGQHHFAQAERFGPSAELGIPALLLRYAAGLNWMLQAGWSDAEAPPCLLIPAYGAMAIAKAVSDGDCPESRQLAASVWAIYEILLSRARFLSRPVPHAYASLRGIYGLATTDPVWEKLLQPDVQLGFSFQTCTVLQASMDAPTCFPDMSASVPIHRLCSVPCELYNGPIVCFVSTRAHSGQFRSLIQTSTTGCHLPPLATITLEEVLEAGTWAVDEVTCFRKCFVLKVAFPL